MATLTIDGIYDPWFDVSNMKQGDRKTVRFFVSDTEYLEGVIEKAEDCPGGAFTFIIVGLLEKKTIETKS